MDCTDMVIGVVRGSASRVFDYYTREIILEIVLEIIFSCDVVSALRMGRVVLVGVVVGGGDFG